MTHKYGNNPIELFKNLLEQKKYKRILKEAAKIKNEYATDLKFISILATCYESLNDTANLVKTWFEIAELYSAQKLYMKERAAYAKILSIDPGNSFAYESIANVDYILGNKNQANESIKQAVKYYLQIEDLNKALSLYELALKNDPTNEFFKVNLLRLYSKTGNSKSESKMYIDIANQLIESKKSTDALTVLKSVLKKDPDNIETLLKIADIYAKQNNHAEALETYKLLLAKNKLDVEGICKLAEDFHINFKDKYIPVQILKSAHKTYPDSIEILKKIVSIDPMDIEAHQILKVHYLEHGEREKSSPKSCVKRFLRVDPGTSAGRSPQRVAGSRNGLMSFFLGLIFLNPVRHSHIFSHHPFFVLLHCQSANQSKA